MAGNMTVKNYNLFIQLTCNNLIRPVFFFIMIIKWVALLVVIFTQKEDHFVEGGFVLSSPPITNFGTWTNWRKCADGRFVKGIEVKFFPEKEVLAPPNVDELDRSDDRGLVRIALECAPPFDSQNGGIIVAPAQLFHPFRAPLPFQCDHGSAVGFELKSQEYQMALDNLGATGINLICSGNSEKRAQPGKLSDGSWTDPQFCGPRQAICGISVQNHNSLFGDKTGINNVRFQCCDMASPLNRCIPTEKWEVIGECDNTDGTLPILCNISRSVGLEVVRGDPEVVQRAADYGFTLEPYEMPHWLVEPFALKVKNWIGLSRKTGFDWRGNYMEMWTSLENIEDTNGYGIWVKEGYRALAFQVTASCSVYRVRTPKVKRVDVTRNNLCRGLECLES